MGLRASVLAGALAAASCAPFVAAPTPEPATAASATPAAATPTRAVLVSPTPSAPAPGAPRTAAPAPIAATLAPCDAPPGWPSDGKLEAVGRHLRGSFDGGKGSADSGFLYLRLHVPEGAPRAAEVATSATVTAAGASLAVTGYLAGRPYAGAAPAGPVVRVGPCETVVLIVVTAPFRSGDVAIVLREIRLPEFVTVSHRWSAALFCSTTGPEVTCTLAP